MANPEIIVWPALDLAAICQTQSHAAEGNLIINGNMTINPDNPGSIIFKGYSRSITITSVTVDNSGVNFKINGTLNGCPVSETITGPNHSTSETTILFDSISSIHVDGAVTDITVGTGHIGRTNWIPANCNVNNNAIYSWQVVCDGVVHYSVQYTNDNPKNVDTPFTVEVGNAADSEYFSSHDIPFSFSSLQVTTTDGTPSIGEMTLTYIQQGN